MKLVELQREMAHAIMSSPLGTPARSRRAVEAIIKPNSRLSSNQRLEIYRQSYWARILASFTEDYPGVCGILGSRAFTRLAKRYLTDCPSRSFTLRDLGSQFESWLKDHPEFAGTGALVVDMARLEWAHIEALDGPAGKPLGAEDLLTPNPGLRFKLQPHITLLALHHPVDDLRIHIMRISRDEPASRQAARRRREVAAVRKCKPGSETERVFLAVYRRDFSVFYRRLSVDEFQLLQALRSGTPLAQALQPFEHALELVGSWFTSWSQMGWLMPAVSAIRTKGEL